MSKNRTGLGGKSSPGITWVVKLEKGSKADTERARQSNCASHRYQSSQEHTHVLRFLVTGDTVEPGTSRERLGWMYFGS